METATLKDGSTLSFQPEKIGEGTMKEVYFTHDRKSVVCMYKDVSPGEVMLRSQRLEKILTKNNPTVAKTNGGAAVSDVEAAYYRNLFCWPTAIVLKPRFGIVAPTYPGHFFFQSGPDFIKGKEKNGMRFIGRKNRSLLEKFAPSELGDFQKYMSLCIRMARAVGRLHTAGLAHSDLSPNNVLVDPTVGASIVIDVDSLVVEGLFPPDVIGTKGYIAPEVLSTVHLPLEDKQRKHPNARTDLHALGVLIYQYLLRRHPLDGKRIPNARTAEEQDMLSYGKEAIFSENPSDASNRPEDKNYVPCTALGPQLNDLFQRAFVKGLHSPNDRPGALEWVRGLSRAWDMLQPCPAGCAQKWYIVAEKTVRCFHCGARPRGPVPVLSLLSERRPGQWMEDNQLAVYHNLTLCKWHVHSNVFPGGPGADTTPQAYFAMHQGQWIMVNQHLDSLLSAAGNKVPPGQAVVLTPNSEFRLSEEPTGRKAVVKMLQP
jgi:serine/threonine protein kinase